MTGIRFSDMTADTSLLVGDRFPFITADPTISTGYGNRTATPYTMLNYVTPQMFGAVGDGVTDDYAAFTAATAFLTAHRLAAMNADASSSTSVFSLPTFHIPLARYYLSQTWEFKTGIFNVEGDRGARLLFPANTNGIMVQASDTTGETTAAVTTGASNSSIRNLVLWGGAGTNTGKHGLWMRAKAQLLGVDIINFPGDGFHIEASSNSSGSDEGNANTWYLETCSAARNGRHGLYVHGADTNAGVCVGFSAIGNARFGIYEDSFLGNTYVGCHTEANGTVGTSGPAANVNTVPTIVSQGGNRYSVILGQETAAKTTTPGTSSAVWTFVEVGGATAEIPAWVSGTTYAAGGAYAGPNTGGRNEFIGCYSEGSQGASQFPGGFSIIIGGLHGAPVRGGIYLRGTSTNVLGVDSMFLSGASAAGTISIALLNSEIANETSRVLTHSVYAPSGYHEKFVTADNFAPFAYNGAQANAPFLITTPGTATTFGRSTPQPHKLSCGEIGIGARIHSSGTAAPATGPHAAGEVVYNEAPAVGGIASWMSSAAGTPGTWQPTGIVGAVQAASVSLAAGANPTKAEFDALVNALKTAKLMA